MKILNWKNSLVLLLSLFAIVSHSGSAFAAKLKDANTIRKQLREAKAEFDKFTENKKTSLYFVNDEGMEYLENELVALANTEVTPKELLTIHYNAHQSVSWLSAEFAPFSMKALLAHDPKAAEEAIQIFKECRDSMYACPA